MINLSGKVPLVVLAMPANRVAAATNPGVSAGPNPGAVQLVLAAPDGHLP